MAKWIYTCSGGRELHNLIDKSGDWKISIKIIEQLKKCYQEIISNYHFEDELDKEEFQEAADLLRGDDLIIKDWMNVQCDIRDFGFNTDEDLVDARLYEFYELCDVYRIWVEV